MNDLTQILNQVKSPFTDEEIKHLIKIFIECNCNMDDFYKRINLVSEEIENPYLNQLYSNLFSNSNGREKYVDGNRSWHFISSSKDALSIPYEMKDRVPIYRIYLNAKGKDKAKIIEEYIKSCEEDGRIYKLKYSVKDGRKDEILILSFGQDLATNMRLIERITDDVSLGEPAELVGRYRDKIGIGEEYIQAPTYSYTQTRLGIIPIILQKFCLDHKAEFDNYLDDSNKKLVSYLLNYYKGENEDLKKILEEVGEVSESEEQEKDELRKRQFAYQNNMDPNFINMYASIFEHIPEAIKTYMEEHYEAAISEIIEDYRLACEVFGISREGVFSKRTEEEINKHSQNLLQKKEAESSSLEAEER